MSEKFLLIILFIVLFVVNYQFLDNSLEKFFDESETILVERVIDGDTIFGENQSVRLLGINTPEKGEMYYQEAKEFLEDKILNKTVELKFGREKQDIYKRTLAYVFYRGENLNLELVKQGFANPYFPSGKDEYSDELIQAWENCEKNNLWLCEKSLDICAECIELKELDFVKEIVIIRNNCDFSCNLENWSIKDEGRKKFIFGKFVLEKNSKIKVQTGEGVNNLEVLYWTNQDYVWTDLGDTLFLRDGKGGLILNERY